MKSKLKVLFLMLIGFLSTDSFSQNTNKLSDLRIRDPYIVADENTNTYYLYGQTGNRLSKDTIKGVEVYKSKDLVNWSGPKTVYKSAPNHWAKDMIWAPEVHLYKGKYYLFVTLTNATPLKPKEENKPPLLRRGTQIFVSDSPEGPFEAFFNEPTTPYDWMSLDGTLWVENDTPYMIFCHEWAQIVDGTMELVELENNLSKPVEKPETLFKATDASWVKSLSVTGYKYNGYVTDGCFVYKTKTDNLIMIWSSFTEKGYALGQLISDSGSIKGPWRHIDELIFEDEGGHGMIFTDFEGNLRIILHQPNSSPNERPRLFELEDLGDKLRLKK